MSSSHFVEWCHNYCEYIEEWYPLFVELFIEGRMKVPTKRDFYWHCYKNSCPTVGIAPEISSTPEIYMYWFTFEQNLKDEEDYHAIIAVNKKKNNKNSKNQNQKSCRRGHSSSLTSRILSTLTHSSFPSFAEVFST